MEILTKTRKCGQHWTFFPKLVILAKIRNFGPKLKLNKKNLLKFYERWEFWPSFEIPEFVRNYEKNNYYDRNYLIYKYFKTFL